MIQATSNLLQKHVVLSYRPYPEFGKIDHNLHNHVFDEVMCNLSINCIAGIKSFILNFLASFGCNDSNHCIKKFPALPQAISGGGGAGQGW